ncbi:Taxadiene 5-alpha hydroxylase [Linum perenne]
MGLPWIGETMDFYKSQRNNRLFDQFVRPRMSRHGKIFKTRLMGSPTIVVNGAEANRFFLSNEFKLVVSSWPASSVQLMGRNSIMEAKGDRHRMVRGLIATSVGYSALEALVPKMCGIVQTSLSRHWGRGETKEVSLYFWTKKLTFEIVFECLLGIEMERGTMKMFERVLEGVFAPPIGFPGSKFSRAKKAREEIERMLLKVVREKRTEVEGGGGGEEEGQLMWRLVKAMIQGEITEEEVVDNVVLLVFAAHDTTSFVVAMMFKMLAQHSDCYRLLLQGPRVCAGSQLAKLNILVLVHYVVTSYDWSLVLPNEGITMDPLPFPSHGMPIRITPKSSISIY